MSLPLVVQPEAELDIDQAYDHYKSVHQPIAARFREELLKAVALVQEHPAMFAVVHRDIRRAQVRRFPYGVFYVTRPDHIAVLGVFHAARSPETWQDRR